MIIAADSAGTVLSARRASEGEPSKAQSFGGTFEPGRTIAWVASARGFLTQPLSGADKGDTRSTPPLVAAGGDGLYQSRRRLKGAWSDERFLVMQTLDDTMPLMVSGDESTIGSILDELAAIARQTTVFADVVRPGRCDGAPISTRVLMPFVFGFRGERLD